MSTRLSSLNGSCHGSPGGDPPNPFMIFYFYFFKKAAFQPLSRFQKFQYFPPLSPFFFFFSCLFLPLLTTSSPIPSPSFLFFYFFLLFFFLLNAQRLPPTYPYPSSMHHHSLGHGVFIYLLLLRLRLSLARRHPLLASPNSLVPLPHASLASLSPPPHLSHSELASLFPRSLSHSVSVISLSLLVSFCFRLKTESLSEV